MDKTTIEELKANLASYPERDSIKEDEMLAQISQVAGWEVLKNRIETRINKLLEPGTGSKDLAFIGAVTMARELAIEVLQSVITEVESSRDAKIKIQVAEEKSEPEAL
jgi:hypothetical protein